MPLRVSQTELPGVAIVEPKVFPDERGFFMETYKRSDLAAHGIAETFVQANHSRSARHTLRGLHYQKEPRSQSKLVHTVNGEVFDVVVDIRKGSPTYGKWLGVSLSATNRRMLYVPRGFAHGFCVLSDAADVLYMTSEEYAPDCEAGIIWNDPELAIEWPVAEPKLSPRDQSWPSLRVADNNFVYSRAPSTAPRPLPVE